MRIIAGKHRGRRIEMKEGKDIRPTSARTREALFNILSHGEFGGPGNSPYIEKRVLDLFCGTGALGLESLSRGASHVTFVDQAQDSLNLVRRTADKWGELGHIRFLRSDSSQLPSNAGPKFSLVFLDPPYHSGLAFPALGSLLRGNWLEEDAICVVELSAKEQFTPPAGMDIFSQRTYGNSQVFLLRRSNL